MAVGHVGEAVTTKNVPVIVIRADASGQAGTGPFYPLAVVGVCTDIARHTDSLHESQIVLAIARMKEGEDVRDVIAHKTANRLTDDCASPIRLCAGCL